MFALISPSPVTTAAAVSSQDVSIPRMRRTSAISLRQNASWGVRVTRLSQYRRASQARLATWPWLRSTAANGLRPCRRFWRISGSASRHDCCRAATTSAAPGTVVERKTVLDLHLTIVEGRLWPQLEGVREAVRSPCLLVEGEHLYRGIADVVAADLEELAAPAGLGPSRLASLRFLTHDQWTRTNTRLAFCASKMASPSGLGVLPHDHRVLPVVGVVAAAEALADEAELLVEADRAVVRDADLEGVPAALVVAGELEHALEQARRDAAAAIVGVDGDVHDVPRVDVA